MHGLDLGIDDAPFELGGALRSRDDVRTFYLGGAPRPAALAPG